MIKSESASVSKTITFLSDGFLLRGILHLPAVERPPLVIGSHGLLSSGSSPKQISLARSLNDAGIAYFRFDHRGCGESQGDFREVTSLENRSTDLIRAICALKEAEDLDRPLGLFGSSFGGTVVLSVAARMPVDAVVTFAAPVESRSIESVEAPDGDGPSPDRHIDRERLRFDITRILTSVRGVCAFHGDADETVPPSSAREIETRTGDPKRLWIFKNGDHRMSDRDHQIDFLRESVRWFLERFDNVKTPADPNRKCDITGETDRQARNRHG
jgi:uncharacterized protein